MDVRINFVQEEPLDLQSLTMISAICVVEEASVNLDIPIWEFWAIWEHPPFFLAESCFHVGCLSCTIKWSNHDIHDFCYCHLWRKCALQILRTHSKDDRCPSMQQSRLFCLFVLPEWPSFCSLRYFNSLPPWQPFELLPFFVHCCVRKPEFSSLEATE